MRCKTEERLDDVRCQVWMSNPTDLITQWAMNGYELSLQTLKNLRSCIRSNRKV